MTKLISSGQYKEALDLFDREYPRCTDVTFTLALKASTKLRDHQRGVRIHQQLTPQLLQNSFIQASLIHFYMQCNCVDDAHRIFSSIDKKDVYIYGAMLKGYMSNNMAEKVLELYENISVEVNEVIITLLFNACAKLCSDHAIKLGKDTFNRLPRFFYQNKILVNSAIDMLMKFGHISDGERLFNQIKNKNIVTYGAMMQGYVTNNLHEKALDLFEEIHLKSNEFLYTIVFSACASLCNDRAFKLGKSVLFQMPKTFYNNVVVVNSILNMLVKFGEMESAERVFSQTKKRTISTYTIMLNGYKINNQPHQCFALFEKMKQQKMTIDLPIALALVGACSQIGMRSTSENIVRHISHIQGNLHLNTALIDMWGKSGDVDKAKQIFQSILEGDVLTYNCMINAYARNGMGYEAINIYEQMSDNIRNTNSHTAVLNACSHSGLIDQARKIFNKIDKKTEGIVIAMIDSLSRVNMLDEAQKMIDDYEKSNSPSLIMYMALLSGARNHRDIVLAKILYNRMKSLFPDQNSSMIAASILVSNTLSSVGHDEQAQEIRINRLKEFGKKIVPGISWTEVNGELVSFKAHDCSHPRSNEIYAELDVLSKELKEHGHQYDSSWITRPLKDGETVESVLCGHSEKLAIAYNLIQQPPPTFIQVTKNLRVCGDCHRATKLIAKIRQCEIVVRDANRIHHFTTNGQCSCQDHF